MSTNLADLKISRYVITAVVEERTPDVDIFDPNDLDIKIERRRVYLAHVPTVDDGLQFGWVDDINNPYVCFEYSLELLEPLMKTATDPESWNEAHRVSNIIPALVTMTAASCKTEYDVAIATAREQKLRQRYNDLITNEFSAEERQMLNIGMRITNTED